VTTYLIAYGFVNSDSGMTRIANTTEDVDESLTLKDLREIEQSIQRRDAQIRSGSVKIISFQAVPRD
jgi:hypothetical protein